MSLIAYITGGEILNKFEFGFSKKSYSGLPFAASLLGVTLSQWLCGVHARRVVGIV